MTPEQVSFLLSQPLPPRLLEVIEDHHANPRFSEFLWGYGEAHALERIELHGKTGLYMVRYFLEDRGNGADGGRTYLHEIRRADEDPEYHDHPWDFDQYGLVGRYIENRFIRRNESSVVSESDVRADGGTYRIDSSTFHRVATLIEGPAWTVIRTGPKKKSWSFLNAKTGKTTPWREFIKGKGLEVVG